MYFLFLSAVLFKENKSHLCSQTFLINITGAGSLVLYIRHLARCDLNVHVFNEVNKVSISPPAHSPLVTTVRRAWAYQTSLSLHLQGVPRGSSGAGNI